MINRKWIFFLSVFLLILCVTANSLALEPRKPIKIEGKKFLPLRVLARPFSNVYKEKNETGGTIMENVSAFQSFYVYTRPNREELELEEGWYEVGSNNRGNVIGWMKANDVFVWKQTMCLLFTHPEGRRPVLMFERRKDLMELIQDSSEERIDRVEGYYNTIETRMIPNDFPIKSLEPKRAVDFSKQFYIMPILDFEVVEIENREARLLKLAAATSAGPDAREKTDIRKDSNYLREATEKSTEVTADMIKKLKIDLIWVMDTTVSMRPHIEKSLQVIQNVSKHLVQNPEVAKSIRFGFWGYRDSIDAIPKIGYTTKNYTPQLEPIDQFIQTLAGIRVTKVDSLDWSEDVFSGINDAINSTSWTPNALRLIILVGDAPGHKLDHPWNLSGQNEKTLRFISDDKSVYIYAVFIKDPRAKKYYEIAESQFRILSMNRGVGDEAIYYDVDSKDLDAFAKVTKSLADAVKTVVSAAKQGNVYFDTDPTNTAPNEVTTTDQIKSAPKGNFGDLTSNQKVISPDKVTSSEKSNLGGQSSQRELQHEKDEKPEYEKLAYKMIRAALVEWIGSQADAKSPRDIVAWATDKDLVDPNIQSMEVRLLINKRQLASLTSVLKDVMAAGRKGQVSGEDFFEMLQATTTTAAREPDQIKNAKSIAQAGLVPEFLKGLPYKSQLMDMSNDLWNSWSIDEQNDFLNAIEAKIQAYQTIHDSPEDWIALNKGDDPGEHVYPIILNLLP